MKKMILYSVVVFATLFLFTQNANASFLGFHINFNWIKGTNSEGCICCGRGTCKITIEIGADALSSKIRLGTDGAGRLSIGVKETDINRDDVQGFMRNGNWYIGNDLHLDDKTQNALSKEGYDISIIRAGSYRSHVEGDMVVFDLGIPRNGKQRVFL